MNVVRDDGILAEEITEFAQKHQGEKFYMLRTDEASFGFLYVGTDVCTLGWQGDLSFEKLDTEILTNLPSRISESRGFHTQTDFDKINVSLILREKELVEYDLKIEKERDQYKGIIDLPDIISFARYDATYRPLRVYGDRRVAERRIQGQPARTIQYAFTVENPRWAFGKSELTILLPRWESWSEGLLYWVINHHVDSDILRKTLDMREFKDILATLAH